MKLLEDRANRQVEYWDRSVCGEGVTLCRNPDHSACSERGSDTVICLVASIIYVPGPAGTNSPLGMMVYYMCPSHTPCGLV